MWASTPLRLAPRLRRLSRGCAPPGLSPALGGGGEAAALDATAELPAAAIADQEPRAEEAVDEAGYVEDPALVQERWGQIGLAVTGIASIGFLDAGYLTLVKLGQVPLACPAAGQACSKVLNSQWASLGPVPLAAVGLLAYGTAMAISISAGPEWPQRQELWWLALALAVASAGLMLVLLVYLHEPCLFCGVSAFASAALLALVEVGQAKRAASVPRREFLALSGAVALAALRGATLPEPPPEGSFYALTELYKPNHPPVQSGSSAAERALARHLAATGAACYTAWWCPHCQEQRENFGAEATALAPFVECAGEDKRQLRVCKEKKVNGYPMWIIDEKPYGGARELAELAELSGFKGFPKEAFRPRRAEEVAYIWGEPEEEKEEP